MHVAEWDQMPALWTCLFAIICSVFLADPSEESITEAQKQGQICCIHMSKHAPSDGDDTF